MSILMEQLGSKWTDFHEIWYLNICLETCRKNSSLITFWQEQRVLCMKIYVIYDNIFLAFLKMRNISDKICRESQNTHFMFHIGFTKILLFYEIMWNNTVEPDRPQVTIRHMRIACCMPKTTDTHLDYVMFVVFPLQQWLQGRASVLRYTYIAFLVVFPLYVVFSNNKVQL
jgi:hypothetical protein